MSQPIEARLRFVADTAQAAANVKALQKDVEGVKGAGGLKQAADEAKKAADASDAAAARAQTNTKKSADEATKALRQTTNQIRAVTMQIPDIVSGLATGQSPFTLLLQQGSQIVEVSGGVGNALRGLGAVFTATRVLALAAAGGLATMVVQIAAGAAESDRLRKILALTGNAANTSLGELDATARRIAETQSASIGSVRDALEAVVASGSYIGKSVESAARAVTALQKATGSSADEALKQLSALDSGVGEGAAKLNRTYNFLTAEQFKYVRSLEAQGRTQEAMRFVMDQLAGTINQRMAPAVGLLEKTWNGVKNAVSGALDALKAIGRDDTPEQRIEKLTQRLAELQALEQQRAAGRNNSGIRRGKLASDTASVQAQLDAEVRQRNSDLLRRQEASIAQQSAQESIDLERKGQDAVLQAAQAGIQKRLAIELAALDARRSAIERANAQGLVSEENYSLALNRIEQGRLAAQLKAIDDQKAAVGAKRPGSPEETKAQATELVRIEAQRIAAVSALEQKRAEARTIADQKSLEEARADAQEWAQIWQRAAGQVRSFAEEAAATRTKLIGDPAARAEAESQQATATVRRELANLERDLEIRIDTLKISPEAKAELQRQLDELRASGDQVVDERTRQAALASLNSIFAERAAMLQAREAEVNAKVQAGLMTQAEGEREILSLRKDQVTVLDEILARMEALARTPEEKALISQIKGQLVAMKDLRNEFEVTARSAGISSLSRALNDIVTGAKTGKAALLDMVGSFAQAMLDVINRRLAEQLVSSLLGSGGGGGGGGFLSSAGSFLASLFHEGGVVGSGSPRTRSVNPAMFALAPRFHTGLLPNEFPAVLERGETVRTVKQERALQRRLAGGVTVNADISISGASGAEPDMRAGAGDLVNSIEAVTEQWAMKQMRPGGLLAGLRPRGG